MRFRFQSNAESHTNSHAFSHANPVADSNSISGKRFFFDDDVS